MAHAPQDAPGDQQSGGDADRLVQIVEKADGGRVFGKADHVPAQTEQDEDEDRNQPVKNHGCMTVAWHGIGLHSIR